MQNKEKIEPIKNINDILKYIQYFSYKIGNISDLNIYDKTGNTHTYMSVDEFFNDMSQKVDIIEKVVFKCYNFDKAYDIELLLLTQELSMIERLDNKMIDIKTIMDEEDADYYKFSNGKYVKYSKKDHLFYIYDFQTNEWKEDPRPLEWIYGSELNSEKLNYGEVMKK